MRETKPAWSLPTQLLFAGEAVPAQRPLGSPLGTGVAGALKKKREQNERVPQICNLEPGRGHESEVGLSGGSQRAERAYP